MLKQFLLERNLLEKVKANFDNWTNKNVLEGSTLEEHLNKYATNSFGLIKAFMFRKTKEGTPYWSEINDEWEDYLMENNKS